MKSVEGLLGEINKAGWLVTEVYQRDHDQWFATLRRHGEFSAASSGEASPTVSEALAKAWEKARDHKRMSNADWQKVKDVKPSVPRFIPGKSK